MNKVSRIKYIWFIIVSVYKVNNLPAIMYGLYRKEGSSASTYDVKDMEEAIRNESTSIEGMEFLWVISSSTTEMMTGNQAQDLGLKLCKQAEKASLR